MPIPESTLSQWSHHRSAKASKQAHVSVRHALAAYEGVSEFNPFVFLQGSYKNGTNLRRDSDVDVVVRLPYQLKPRLVSLTGQQLQGDADLVVTLSYRNGIGFYLPDERRWVVSYPEQHHERGAEKEEATGRRFKRTIRMFKAARNRLVEKETLSKDDAPSYFIECLLYNVPNHLFKRRRAATYTGILAWMKTAKLRGLKCQNEKVPLFGKGREQWTVDKARALAKGLQELWEAGG